MSKFLSRLCSTVWAKCSKRTEKLKKSLLVAKQKSSDPFGDFKIPQIQFKYYKKKKVAKQYTTYHNFRVVRWFETFVIRLNRSDLDVKC